MYLLALVLVGQGGFKDREQECNRLASFYITLGVMEESERAHFFGDHRQMESGVHWMNWRIAEGVLDCPSTVDALRFPNRMVARTGWQMSLKYKDYLEERIAFNFWPTHLPELELHLKDAKVRVKLWDRLDNLRIVNDVRGKRLRLKELREVLGAENYEQGIFPHPLSNAALDSYYLWKDYRGY